MTRLDEMDWDDADYQNWAGRYSAWYWNDIAEWIDKSNYVNKRDATFMKSIARQSGSRTRPLTPKQIRKAKLISDIYESETEQSKTRREKVAPNGNRSHLSVRMAWHDSRWNGKICSNPEANDYCVGEYSLLSRRIREQRDLSVEMGIKGEEPVPHLKNNYQPPCFWSLNAFGKSELSIRHLNPAAQWPAIEETLPPNSIFTWPFKLSFVRDYAERQRDGKYPANLEGRIDNFARKVKARESIAFLYSNYDNPVTGEERQYLLLGCALVKDLGNQYHFDVNEEELLKKRKVPGAKNFPTLNWALRLTLDYPDNAVVLPYHQYLEDAEKTGDDTFLQDMKVAINEPELMQCFKYVAMDIDEDQAIYLLTKIKRSLYRIRNHGRIPQSVVDADIEKVETMLSSSWRQRGHFPGFERLLGIALDRDEGEPLKLCELLRSLEGAGADELPAVFTTLLNGTTSMPSEYRKYKDEIEELREVLESKGLDASAFLTIAMLNLRSYQFKKLWNGTCKDPDLYLEKIADNPYVLFENYQEYVDSEIDPVTGEDFDQAIELFKIDIALFPDRRYLSKLAILQKLMPHDKRRIRALIIDYLRNLEGTGDCFDYAEKIESKLKDYPLFYKSEYVIPLQALLDPDESNRVHFNKKLELKQNAGNTTYYLKAVSQAEEYIGEIVQRLAVLPDLHSSKTVDQSSYVVAAATSLKSSNGDLFDDGAFRTERLRLFEGIFKKRLFVLGGAPGTGKSHELLHFLSILKNRNEQFLVLTPTGKAALRLSSDDKYLGIGVKTIDKFLSEFGDKLPVRTCKIQNLVVDEMSMVDLLKFDSLLRVFDFDDPKFRRVILVGDPNQLPPIGFGKPFLDIIRYLQSQEKSLLGNMVYLGVNCRQKLDDTVLDFARVFSGENKNYEGLFQRVQKGGEVSEGLHVEYWMNKEELHEKLLSRFRELYTRGGKVAEGVALNRIFGLQDDGSLKMNENSTVEDLSLDAFQIISPYRTGFSGGLGLNNFLQREFKQNERKSGTSNLMLFHSDKVIQVENLYGWGKERGMLKLSNGSIGVFTMSPKKQIYFPELGTMLSLSDMKEESMELGYAITVHKAQGSGFEHVFLVIPQRRGLLSRELLYTALTRSRAGITLFMYGKSGSADLSAMYDFMRRNSFVETRKTTLLGSPIWDYSYSPHPGVLVRSRAEYIIFKKLESLQQTRGDFTFEYEKPLTVKGGKLQIHPDFSISTSDGRSYFLEHLGLWGRKSYERSWSDRLELYLQAGLLGSLITTDELHGIHDDRLTNIVNDLVGNELTTDASNSRFSRHHYSL